MKTLLRAATLAACACPALARPPQDPPAAPPAPAQQQVPPQERPPADAPPQQAPPQDKPPPTEAPPPTPPPPAAPTQAATAAADPPPAAAAPASGDPDEAKADEHDHVVTRHAITIGGERVEYTARAGTLPVLDEKGEAKAHVFFVAYTRDGVADLAQRPLTFSFNGGPGSSSVWLHLGALGPRRVALEPDGWAPPPPYRLADNEHSWLDATDRVFFVPVCTGYCGAAEGEDPQQFHGLDEDARAVGEFIRLYTTRFGRWSSPKVLAGESYGTTRAARLAAHLQERHGLYLNGLVLISAVLDFQTTSFDVGNDLPYVLFLPTYAATAWYHGRVPQELKGDLRAFLDEVETFARGEYATALLKGAKLAPEERERLVARLGRYTGLSLDYLDRANLRVDIGRFTKELLRDQRRTVGRLDSRYPGIDLDAAGERYEYDPSYAAILGPFTGALNQYVRGELGYESDLPYEILTGKVHPWQYPQRKGYVNVGETLRGAMTRNPHLKVLVAAGYYDLATPYHAAEYTVDHLGLDPSLAANVRVVYYESGHMMYVHQPSLAALKQDVASFLRAACGS